MDKNVTLSLDERILQRAKIIAVEQNMSLSRWLVQLIDHATSRSQTFEQAKKRVLRRMKTGLHLGGKPLSREALHER